MGEALYRGWDRERIDAELNLRARWPEHADFFARWAAESRGVREQLGHRGLVDLAYGSSTGERLDLFRPEDADRAPILAFIHGGYWQSLDKGDFSHLAPPFLEAGIAFASLNYDLAPKARIGDMVAQIRRALAWLYGHAGDYGLDRDRLYVAGHSAGGHLALMAMDGSWPAEEGLPPDVVKGGCSISGVYDLEPLRHSYQQPVLRIAPEDVEPLSPLRRVPAAAGPLVCAVGDEETEEFRRQQDELLAAWRKRGLDALAVALPGRHHFSAVDALGESDHPLHAAVRALVREGSTAA